MFYWKPPTAGAPNVCYWLKPPVLPNAEAKGSAFYCPPNYCWFEEPPNISAKGSPTILLFFCVLRFIGPPDVLVFPYAKGSLEFFPRFIPLSKALEKGSAYGLKEVDFEANGSGLEPKGSG